MPGLTTAWVARAMRARGYDVVEGPDSPITGGAFDSRRARPGDLFAAFPGENTDGNLFVPAAFESGAVAALCSRAPAGEWPGTTVIVASDVTRAVGELAREWRDRCGPTVVGITGTVGKTTAKEVTAAVLGTRFATHRSEGNMNSREGLPLALLSLTSQHDVSVLELAMDSVGEIAYLCSIARPAVGVVLNIGLTHVSKVGSPEAIAAEKLALPRALPPDGTAVLNTDDPRIAAAVSSLSCRTLTFGACKRADLRLVDLEDHGLEGTRFSVSYRGRESAVSFPLPGRHVIPAALAAIGSALALGMELDEASAALASLAGVGRMNTITTPAGVTILDDRYNSSPASLQGALRALASLPGRHIALLGKMAELGEHSRAEHRRAGEVAAASCDLLFTFGEECRPLADAAREAGHPASAWFPTRDEAAAAAAAALRPGDVVLVKGSRSEELEAVIPLLEAAG